MNSRTQQRLHLLEIPTARFPLLVPSATVAEVTKMAPLAPLPLSPHWVLGVVGWRARALAVISFDALLARAVSAANPRERMIVFYPPPGARAQEFFAIVSTREPQPHALNDSSELISSAAGAVESPYISATVKFREKILLIPNMDALAAALYP